MFKKKEKKTELQREMEKYMGKMRKLNRQFNNLDAKVKKLQMDNKRYMM